MENLKISNPHCPFKNNLHFRKEYVDGTCAVRIYACNASCCTKVELQLPDPQKSKTLNRERVYL
jgi:hypothetical protein